MLAEMFTMIQVEENKNVLEIKLPFELDASFAEEMLTQSKSWLLIQVEAFVFDFRNVRKVAKTVYRPFMIFSKLVKQGGKRVVSINMNAELVNQFKGDGIIQAFNVVAIDDRSKLSNVVTAPKTQASFDANILNTFLEALTNTFQIQAQTNCKAGRASSFRIEDKDQAPTTDIVAIISLTTPRLRGTVAIAFPGPVFLKIYENMFGEKHSSITVDLQDAAGELLNILYGAAKTKLNQTPGYELQPAIPTVLCGEKISVYQKTHEKVIVIPFESNAGPFRMEIALDGKNSAAA